MNIEFSCLRCERFVFQKNGWNIATTPFVLVLSSNVEKIAERTLDIPLTIPALDIEFVIKVRIMILDSEEKKEVNYRQTRKTLTVTSNISNC